MEPARSAYSRGLKGRFWGFPGSALRFSTVLIKNRWIPLKSCSFSSKTSSFSSKVAGFQQKTYAFSMENTPKEASWEPKSQLDHELLAVAKLFFASEPCDVRINWAITTHCHTRWSERFGTSPVLSPTNHPVNDLRNPRLRQCTAKEVGRILAACAGHAGEASRGTHYFILADPSGGMRDRVFVATVMDTTSQRYNRWADLNMVAITCFPYIRTTGAARRTSGGHQKQIRLRSR